MDERACEETENDIGHEAGMKFRRQLILVSGDGKCDSDYEMKRPQQSNKAGEGVRTKAGKGRGETDAPENGRSHLEPVIGQRMIGNLPRAQRLELSAAALHGANVKNKAIPQPTALTAKPIWSVFSQRRVIGSMG